MAVSINECPSASVPFTAMKAAPGFTFRESICTSFTSPTGMPLDEMTSLTDNTFANNAINSIAGLLIALYENLYSAPMIAKPLYLSRIHFHLCHHTLSNTLRPLAPYRVLRELLQ